VSKVQVLQSYGLDEMAVVCLQEVHVSDVDNLRRLFPGSCVVASLRQPGQRGGIATVI